MHSSTDKSTLAQNDYNNPQQQAIGVTVTEGSGNIPPPAYPALHHSVGPQQIVSPQSLGAATTGSVGIDMQPGTSNMSTGSSLQVVSSVPLVNGIVGDRPMTVGCKNCNTMVSTKTTHVIGKHSWMVAMIYFIVGIITVIPWFLCWIPFCQKKHKDVEHYCPNCGVSFGRYRR